MRSTGWDEYGIADELNEGAADDSVVVSQALPQRLVQVPRLVVDRVVMF